MTTMDLILTGERNSTTTSNCSSSRKHMVRSVLDLVRSFLVEFMQVVLG